jgi:hypothetical protein
MPYPAVSIPRRHPVHWHLPLTTSRSRLPPLQTWTVTDKFYLVGKRSGTSFAARSRLADRGVAIWPSPGRYPVSLATRRSHDPEGESAEKLEWVSEIV